MMTSFNLAWRGLLHEKIYLWCNIAVICGVLVPLLVLQGVKSGVYAALIADIASDPTALSVTTLGDQGFLPEDIVEVAQWPETEFVSPRTRNIGNIVLVQNPAGSVLRDATTLPSAAGDPLLNGGVPPDDSRVVVSALLAEVADLTEGAPINILAHSEARPRALVIAAEVAAILPSERLAGPAMLVDPALLEWIEAYYEGYALPDLGIEDGADLATRVIVHEGLRLYARTLADVGALERRLVKRFEVPTRSQAAQIERVFRLGRNLDLAFAIIASTAVLGLISALVFGFWADVQRKKQILATLALIGFTPGQIACIPLLQALLTAVFALVIAFVLFTGVAQVADAFFADVLKSGQPLILLSAAHGAVAVGLTLVSVAVAATWASLSALGTDPAIVFRS